MSAVVLGSLYLLANILLVINESRPVWTADTTIDVIEEVVAVCFVWTGARVLRGNGAARKMLAGVSAVAVILKLLEAYYSSDLHGGYMLDGDPIWMIQAVLKDTLGVQLG